jgi:hypothetical protein
MSVRERPLTIHVGATAARIKRYGESEIRVAEILGSDRNERGGVTAIYLDRLVHSRSDIAPEGWSLSGAITTILHPPGSFEWASGEVVANDITTACP